MGRDVEFALLRLNIKSVLQQSLQNLSNVNPVLLHRLGEDQDVVEVNENGMVQHVPENVIDQGLEDRGGVGEPEGHN